MLVPKEQKTRPPAPYGYSFEKGNAAVDPAKGEVVEKIFRSYLEGVSCARIAENLTGDGVPAPRGDGWAAATVLAIIRNRAYAGGQPTRLGGPSGRRKANVRGPTDQFNTFPAIVSQAEWHAAQLQRRRNSKFAARNSKRVYPLRGLVRCGVCGGTLAGQTVIAKEKEYRYYRCMSLNPAKPCRAVKVRAEELEEIIWAGVSSFLRRPSPILKRVLTEIRDGERKESVLWRESARIDQEIKKVKAARQRLVKAISRGTFTADEVSGEIDRLRVALDDLRSARQGVEEKARDLSFRGRQVRSISVLIDEVKRRLADAAPELKSAFMRRLVERVVVTIRTDQGGVIHHHAKIHYGFPGP